jgi:flavin reductase (DIM6/NTAB) family NADH-FMN oxidoreductase RutF
MEVDPATFGNLYRTLTSLVVPRPIGWISTRSEDGVDNLAPYSFFNVACVAPPVLQFAPGKRPGRANGRTDSQHNAETTGEFVVNVVTSEFAAAMNATSATLGPEASEFDHAGIERAESTKVAPPRVAGVVAAFECVHRETVEIGSNALVLGEVVYAHVDDRVVDEDGKVDVDEVDVVGRLAANWYDRVESRFEMERPD